MDVQMKKGLLDICVLSVLAKGDSYGYQIISDVSRGVAISESTLYPILKRLESGGALTTYSVAHNGRLRKYYRITDAGRAKIAEFLDSWHEMQAIYDFISGKEPEDHDKI